MFSPFLLSHVESVLIYYLASPNRKLKILSRPLRGKAHLENFAFVWKNPIYAPGRLTWSATEDNKQRYAQLLKRLTLHLFATKVYPARMKINLVTKDKWINLQSALKPRSCREAKTAERCRFWQHTAGIEALLILHEPKSVVNKCISIKRAFLSPSRALVPTSRRGLPKRASWMLKLTEKESGVLLWIG